MTSRIRGQLIANSSLPREELSTAGHWDTGRIFNIKSAQSGALFVLADFKLKFWKWELALTKRFREERRSVKDHIYSI